MNLIIIIPPQISRRTQYMGIFIIKGLAGYGMAISVRMMKPVVKRELTKLFDPIKENADTERIKSVFPIQTAFYKRRQAYTQNRQGKEMPPDELRCLPGFVPNVLNSIHLLSPLHSFILSPLSAREFIKNNIFFNRSQKLCP